jgi:hypothetical protein
MKGKRLAPEIEALSDVLAALGKLTTDDEKGWVLETASNRLGVTLPTLIAKRHGADGSGNNANLLPNSKPKGFVRAKDPKSDVQRVACLAFYLTQSRETAKFKSADLSALNTEAAGPSINMPRAANNATNQNRYLAAAGGGHRQITALGEYVVNALPNQEAVRAVELQSKKSKRRKRKGTAKAGKK